jgi:hypothetical protein
MDDGQYAEHTEDPSTPLFFVSYSYPHTAGRDDRESILFKDLSEDVGELVGRNIAEYPGFMDHSTMQGGEYWSPEILTAVGQCQVFVPLISPSSVRSVWCAMEWDAFARRKLVKKDPKARNNRSAILPVLWAKVQRSEMPPVVREIQFFRPAPMSNVNLHQPYWDEGIYGLLNAGKVSHDIYRAVVWRLAQQIVEINRTYYVEPAVPDSASLQDIFREQAK